MKDLEEANKILDVKISRTEVQADFSYLKKTMWIKGVGAVQNGRSKTIGYSFDILLQVILQTLSTITKREEEISRIPYASVVRSLMYVNYGLHQD